MKTLHINKIALDGRLGRRSGKVGGLAAHLGITPQHMSEVLAERTPMTLDRLNAIAVFLKCDATDLLESREVKTPAD